MTEAQEHLILKYLQGNLSPEERETFESWLNASELNRRIVNEFKKVWSVSADSSTPDDFQHNEEWNRLASAIEETPVVTIERKSYPYLLKIAAAVILFIVASGVIYLAVLRDKEIIRETTSQVEKIVLPDGSEVWLNQNSRITYSNSFGEDRNLYLKGEAFFDVKPDPEKPFTITTEGAQVKVLGTSFNVRAYPDEAHTEVFVATGKVSLSATSTTQSIVLTPGSNGILSKKDGTIIHYPHKKILKYNSVLYC
jgi:transmembrane sensor